MSDILMRTKLNKEYRFELIIGQHPKLLKILKLVTQVADTQATVIVYGESGTGKELIAQALHNNSRRREYPFVPINCAALSDGLLESELFGHVRGAFTGAFEDKQGWFGCSNKGTIFLDEIHDMSSALQMKILRVLQAGEYSMVGSAEIKKSDVRIVVATNQDLEKRVMQNNFREDLFYRLNVIDMTLPPLRQRRSDIPLLIDFFLTQFGKKYNRKNQTLSVQALNKLCSYDFPGNIRELKNCIERLVVLAENDTIDEVNMPLNILKEDDVNGKQSPFKEAKQHAMEKFEREYINDCLKETRGNITHAAQNAGLHVTNFYIKLKKYNINPYQFKAAQ